MRERNQERERDKGRVIEGKLRTAGQIEKERVRETEIQKQGVHLSVGLRFQGNMMYK